MASFLFRFQLVEQPRERLDDSARLDAEWHLDAPVRLITRADCAGDADREELMPFQPLAALLHQARCVPLGKRRRIIEAVLALIGLREYECQRPVFPAVGINGFQLAQVADE